MNTGRLGKAVVSKVGDGIREGTTLKLEKVKMTDSNEKKLFGKMRKRKQYRVCISGADSDLTPSENIKV